jgi:hypothetical protein
MRLLIFISIITNLFLSSCNSNRKVQILNSKGLDNDNLRLNSILFLNFDTGFIAGSIDSVFSTHKSDTFANLKRNAVIFKTNDGGATWQKMELGTGFIRNIIKSGEKLFLFKESENYTTTSVLYSNNNGDGWYEIKSIPNQIQYFFYKDSSFYAIAVGEDSVKSKLSISNDNCQTWQAVTNFNVIVYDCVLHNEDLIYITSNYFGDTKKFIVVYNLKSLDTKAIALPNGFDFDFLTNHDNDLRIGGKKDDSIVIYKIGEMGLERECSYIERNRKVFLQGFYNHNNSNWLILGMRTNFDVRNKILKTTDHGKNWEEVYFAIDNYIKPFYFINKKDKTKAWFYSGNARFQILGHE